MSRIGAVLLILLLVFAVPIMDAIIGRQPSQEYEVFTLGKNLQLAEDSSGNNVLFTFYNGNSNEIVAAKAYYDDDIGGLVMTVPESTLSGTPYVCAVRIFVNDTDKVIPNSKKMTFSIEATDLEVFDAVTIDYATSMSSLQITSDYLVLDPEDDITLFYTNGTQYEFEFSDADRLKLVSMYGKDDYTATVIKFYEYNSECKKTLNPGDILTVKIRFYVPRNVDITAIKERYYVALTLVYVVALAVVYRAQLGRIFKKARFELPFGGRW